MSRKGRLASLTRLARLGIGQARYFGRTKTELQLKTSAAVVNLRLIWNRARAEAGGMAGQNALKGRESASVA